MEAYELMDMAHELIETARLDLEGAKILYKKKLYPQAVFLFQQSVEKANKGMALHLGFIKEGELKYFVGHRSIMIYKKVLGEQKKIPGKIRQGWDKNPELKKLSIFKGLNLEEYEREMNQGSSQLGKYEKEMNIRMSSREIRLLISDIEKEKKQKKVKNFEETQVQKIKEFTSELYEILALLNPKKAEEEKRNLEKFDWKILIKMLRTISTYLYNFLPAFVSLLNMAIITLPHATATRYPEANSSPKKIYTKKLPIVKMLPELMGLHEDALKRLKSLTSIKPFETKEPEGAH